MRYHVQLRQDIRPAVFATRDQELIADEFKIVDGCLMFYTQVTASIVEFVMGFPLSTVEFWYPDAD